MYTHHKVDHEFAGDINPVISYMVCALPRSGSSLLCELLCNTGRAGAPTEFFDPNFMEEFKTAWGVRSLDEYVDALLRRKTSPNGVFGFKVHFGQLFHAFGTEDVTDFFPNLHFVSTSRYDRLRQAISYARAEQTGQWASDHPHAAATAVFDRAQITSLLHEIEQAEAGWREFFDRGGVSPFSVVYEDFIASPEQTVVELMDSLYIPTDGVRVTPPTLERQADSLSERWLGLYSEGR